MIKNISVTYHIALLKVYMQEKKKKAISVYLFLYLSNTATEFCQNFIFLHIRFSWGFISKCTVCCVAVNLYGTLIAAVLQVAQQTASLR